jgi:hypothetical protein
MLNFVMLLNVYLISKIMIPMQYLYSKQFQFMIYFLHTNSGSINLLFIVRKSMHEYKCCFLLRLLIRQHLQQIEQALASFYCGKNIKLCINLAKMGSGIKIDLSRTYSVRKCLLLMASILMQIVI